MNLTYIIELSERKGDAGLNKWRDGKEETRRGGKEARKGRSVCRKAYQRFCCRKCSRVIS